MSQRKRFSLITCISFKIIKCGLANPQKGNASIKFIIICFMESKGKEPSNVSSMYIFVQL
jgi:hypothetical protein